MDWMDWIIWGQKPEPFAFCSSKWIQGKLADADKNKAKWHFTANQLTPNKSKIHQFFNQDESILSEIKLKKKLSIEIQYGDCKYLWNMLAS